MGVKYSLSGRANKHKVISFICCLQSVTVCRFMAEVLTVGSVFNVDCYL